MYLQNDKTQQFTIAHRQRDKDILAYDKSMYFCLLPFCGVFSTNMLLFFVVIEPKGAGAEGDGDGMPRTLTFSTGVCRVRLVVETVISQYKYASS